jgi:hypothetical protein
MLPGVACLSRRDRRARRAVAGTAAAAVERNSAAATVPMDGTRDRPTRTGVTTRSRASAYCALPSDPAHSRGTERPYMDVATAPRGKVGGALAAGHTSLPTLEGRGGPGGWL